jgi:hypothetical protein
MARLLLKIFQSRKEYPYRWIPDHAEISNFPETQGLRLTSLSKQQEFAAMWTRVILPGLAFLALSSSFCPILAQSVKESEGATSSTSPSHPNLSGIWVVNPAAAGSYSSFMFTKDEPPMTAWAEEKFKAAKPIFGPNKKTPRESDDPVYGCFPPGLPRIYLQRRPMEILQLPEELIIAYQYDRLVRHIYTDGRPHDDFIDPPLWMGDSIGKWEGDALVVDVIGFNAKTWLDRIGHPHSEALHLIERFRRPDHATLVDDITVEDPKAYTKPWTARLQFQLKSGAEVDWEEVCENEKLRDRQ